jgi:hypothetical protein
LARGERKDFAGSFIAMSRRARLAGFDYFSAFKRDFMISFKLPGETELGNAEEQPNKG